MVNRRLIIPALLFTAAVAAVAAAAAGDKQSTSFAIVGGTVFQGSGFSLPGAEVMLMPGEVMEKRKVRKLTVISSPRGEFTFRVPPVAAKYKVSVTCKGFVSSEKIIETHGGEERVEATFTLSPQSK